MQKLRNQYDLLMILTLIGIVPALFYYLIADKEIFLGLTWNTFLGLLPFYFAIKANSSVHQNVRYFSAFLWLLFLPNAPYIITDMIHISENKGHEGFVLFLVAILSFTGLLSWLFSVRLMLAKLPGALRQWQILRKYGYLILCILSGIGVAMGRFARLNSWEVFYHPFKVARTTFYMYTDILPWMVTISIALILYGIGIFKFEKLKPIRK
ncbi:MAG: DUF1361 domain-containing protein [Bacteroidia bacterium]